MSTKPSTLEDAIRQSGEGWLIDSFAPSNEAMQQILQTLESINRLADDRLGHNKLNVSAETLLHEYYSNSLRVRGFFQALGVTRTPDMLLMVWRIIQGMEVRDVKMSYSLKESFEVIVILQSPYGEEDAPYVSRNVNDFALFRHIGAFEIGGTPVLDGFYALKIRGIR